MKKYINELYNYRELFKTSIQKEIRGKYKGAWLGLLWSFLNPMFQTLIIGIVFTVLGVNKDIKNYILFLTAAQIPWIFFTTTLIQATYSVVANGNIVKKVYFPREIIPISAVTANLVNIGISTIIIFLVAFFTGWGFSWHLVFIPIVIFVQYLVIIAIALFTSSLCVYFRDLEHLLSVFLQALYYGTPILFSMEKYKAGLGKFQFILIINPMTHITEAFRAVFYYHRVPDFMSLGVVALISCVFIVLGIMFFRKIQKNFAEEF